MPIRQTATRFLLESVITGLIAEQAVAATKPSFDSVFRFINNAVQGPERLVELNVRTVKTTLAEAEELAGKSLCSQGPLAAFTAQMTTLQPAAEKAQAY